MGKISSKKLHDIVEYEKFKISINTNSLANENSMYTTETIGLLAVMATMIIGYKDNLLIISPFIFSLFIVYSLLSYRAFKKRRDYMNEINKSKEIVEGTYNQLISHY